MYIKIVLCIIAISLLCSCQAGISDSGNSSNISKNTSVSDSSSLSESASISDDSSGLPESKSFGEAEKQPNVQTPGGESLEMTDEDKIYQDNRKRAIALEAYLRDNLSGDDYGGLYLFKGDKVELTVLAINRGNIDKVIGEYSGKPYKVNILEGDYCPHSKLEAFAGKVEALNSPSERKIIAILSEENNWVAVNVYKEALPEVEDSINKIAAELSMPEGSWKLVMLDPNGENPNT